jgi:hypothetical protein
MCKQSALSPNTRKCLPNQPLTFSGHTALMVIAHGQAIETSCIA